MEKQVIHIKELLTELVVPEQRASLNIIPEHVTMLTGTKTKRKLLSKKKVGTKKKIRPPKASKKSKTLNRRQYRQLGLNALPTHELKYKDALDLHEIWKNYMRDYLGLTPGSTVPEIHEKKFEVLCRTLAKLDLHGAKLRVTDTKCSTMSNLQGIVVLEKKNIIKIISKDNRIRTLPKSECNFGITVDNLEFYLFGRSMCVRPAERSGKKLKSVVKPLKYK